MLSAFTNHDMHQLELIENEMYDTLRDAVELALGSFRLR